MRAFWLKLLKKTTLLHTILNISYTNNHYADRLICCYACKCDLRGVLISTINAIKTETKACEGHLAHLVQRLEEEYIANASEQTKTLMTFSAECLNQTLRQRNKYYFLKSPSMRRVSSLGSLLAKIINVGSSAPQLIGHWNYPTDAWPIHQRWTWQSWSAFILIFMPPKRLARRRSLIAIYILFHYHDYLIFSWKPLWPWMN